MTLIGETPYIPCYVRNEFFHNEENDHSHGEFTQAIVFGFRAEPARVPMFQVMLENGAQWARVPLHMIVSQPCSSLPLELTCWWDCYGYEFSILSFPFLKGHKVEAIGRDKKHRKGTYLFTIDWMKTGWSEVPDQHKNHHVLVLDSGQWIAYPNNRLIWSDDSWITPLTDRPKEWKTPTKTYSVESKF